MEAPFLNNETICKQNWTYKETRGRRTNYLSKYKCFGSSISAVLR